MNKMTLPQLAIKILGLILIVISIPTMPFAVYAVIRTAATHQASALIPFARSLPYIIYFIFGCVFLFASKQVSNKMIISEDKQVTPATLESLQTVLYSGVGLCLIALAFPKFAELYAGRVYMKSIEATSSMDGYEITKTISVGVQLIAGIWLFLGTKGLIGLRDKLRNFGVKDPS